MLEVTTIDSILNYIEWSGCTVRGYCSRLIAGSSAVSQSKNKINGFIKISKLPKGVDVSVYVPAMECFSGLASAGFVMDGWTGKN